MLAKQSDGEQNRISGAESLIKSLNDHDVELLFGYPGGAVLPIYDTIFTSSFTNILTRHEQGAAHAAEGYAKVTGKTGVILVTSGPGASNAITGIADAMMDSAPMVVLTGQVGTGAIGTHAFQELDVISMTKAVTKANFQVTQTSDLARTLDKAFEIAQSGRKGPVLVDLPKDVMASMTFEDNQPACSGVDDSELMAEQKNQLNAILAKLKLAEKPLLLFGAGVGASNAGELAAEFAHKWQIPVVSTLLGLGILKNDDPLFLGMGGMHGSYASNMAFQECDFLLNVGSRFDDRLVPNVSKFAPNAEVAHVDVDTNEIDRIVTTQYSVVADAKKALEYLNNAPVEKTSSQAWLQRTQDNKTKHTFHYSKDDDVLKPQEVIEAVGRVTNGEATVVTDVGQHQMWVAQFYPFKHQRQLVTSGGLGTMGFGLPAAIGAKYADPKKDVVLFVGDGGIQMTSEELEVLAAEKLNIKIILLNNRALGMVRQWQDEFYDKRRSQTVFTHQPDFEKLASAYGVAYYELTKNDDLDSKLNKLFEKDEPALIHVSIPELEQVYPMIAPGSANDEMMGLDK
ncbi:biosynthetic-type acetolactate synthase large subunit [Companilactobacillus mishanensis]|uniref:biosynthetic-type acetolactate synthase large subunit n=1 Tax=Companilactobacillus mishanensis TaxID=2486008 RepID=UPI001298177F|nr:biosynthetic-type acetolactate synthase large subunit [Companilactobacillus mishanensis]MQS89230.1 biosynthetic-type acetolactate synthase large subunit [Companilactobacillus mishanensis]